MKKQIEVINLRDSTYLVLILLLCFNVFMFQTIKENSLWGLNLFGFVLIVIVTMIKLYERKIMFVFR
jgi:hypothetical protein